MGIGVDLVDALGSLPGVDRTRVMTRFRFLRDTGQIRIAGRGKNAASMTDLDASKLLVSLLWGPNAKESTREADDLLQLRARETAEVDLPSPDKAKTFDLPHLRLSNLPRRHSLADALQYLLKAAGEAEYRTGDPRFAVGVYRPARAAKIVIWADDGGAVVTSYGDGAPNGAFETELRTSRGIPHPFIELRQITSVGINTLAAAVRKDPTSTPALQ